tara:strand:- start:586 stop:810 length:225 start_codon:yes stop_codon:yes gene_type:complete
MSKENYIQKLINVNKLINEDILSNPSFGIEDLELVQEKMAELIDQLEFWHSQDNEERFIYELKKHLDWIVENYS